MNSSTPGTMVSFRLYSVRIARWLARLVWNRCTGWTLICLVSLITLYWQWENWRSAREMAAVHRRVIERLGTDDPFTLMPPKVADEDNYFANPVFESWLHLAPSGPPHPRYTPPANALLPAGFIRPEILVADDDGDCDKLDLDNWIKKQRGPSNGPAATVLARQLADGNGLLPKLAEGLNKPFSIIKPGQREALETVGDNPWKVSLPDFHGLNDFLLQMGLHLRSAALAGDAQKTAATALIMLRFSEGTARGGMVGCLVPLAAHNTTFSALHEAMNHPAAWTEESLGRLQVRLGQFDDLQQYQYAHGQEILGVLFQLSYLRKHRDVLSELTQGGSFGSWWKKLAGDAFCFGMIHGPVGWHDANVAFYSEWMLDLLGPPGPETWLTAGSRSETLLQRNKTGNSWPNPRRILGALAIPHIGNITRASAQTLFRRRCLIIACALEKHRLKHGSFPESLDGVKGDLKLFQVTDPARPALQLGYRLEPSGYLLWSAGPDAKDDSGQAGKDWLWRMKREP
ncbi:MAG: hypothetical protein JWR15_2987 [Prosthecobacter sp.]|nr:hypothetical protein [Prosthecobacter sp.]